jgi:hypothetical protein
LGIYGFQGPDRTDGPCGKLAQTVPGKGWSTSYACMARCNRGSARHGKPGEFELVK